VSERFDHDELLDTAAAWVLGALPDDEAAAFEALLATDPEAQAEVARLQPVADALGLAVPPAQPPPSLKANVMAIVEREAELLAAAGPEADRPPAPPAPERRGRLARLFARPGLVAAACACALAIGIGIGLGLSSGGPDTVEHPVTGVQQWASVSGDVVQRGDHGELQLANVPRLPNGQVYKVWLMRDGKPVGDRAFTPDPDGTASVNLRGDLHGASAVAISRETDPDVTAPTTTPIVTASMA
jgi:anti-sigma-K factor RskA